jgi:hypothetical protein
MSAQALCHNVVRAGICTPHDGFSTLRTFIVRSVSVASTLRLPIPPPHKYNRQVTHTPHPTLGAVCGIATPM